MPIALERSICCDLNNTISREWFISNGRGGYAWGTVAGVLTRMQHGLLVASPYEANDTDTAGEGGPTLPDGRDKSGPYGALPATSVINEQRKPHLLLAKIDEEVCFDERTYYLGTNEYSDGTLNPSGFVHLETFALEDGFPVFTYRLGGINGVLLEKRIWMPQGQNTTYIQYRVLRSSQSRGTISRENGYEYFYKDANKYTDTHSDMFQHALTLTLLPFSAYRPYNVPQYGNNDWHFSVQVHANVSNEVAKEEERRWGEVGEAVHPRGVAGCTITAHEGASPYHLLAVGHPESSTTFIPTSVWYWHFLRRHEQALGRAAVDDLYLPGVIRAKLWPSEDCTLTIVATAEELSLQPLQRQAIARTYAISVEQQRDLIQPQRYFGESGEITQKLQTLPLPATVSSSLKEEEFLQVLLQAGQRFLVRQKIPYDRSGTSALFFAEEEQVSVVLSNYETMDKSIRDTLIALPGLLLATRRYDEARRILRSLARHFREGMLPERFPQIGLPLTKEDYQSVDTSLWYFYALDAYLQATQDYVFLDDVYQRLVNCIEAYRKGNSYGISVTSDGLLAAHQPGKAMTWMNASLHDIAITPRSGKAVEVNALWYMALSLMHEWSQKLYSMGRINHQSFLYQEHSKRCKESFQQRFWNAEAGYLYDVVDGPRGNDASRRPNQLFALSLRYPVLDTAQRKAVFEAVTSHLLTPYGLRTLAPTDMAYKGSLQQSEEDRASALHQGSIWPWLLGPYLDALFAISLSQENDAQEYLWRKGLQLLAPFRIHLQEGVLGMIGDVFDNSFPHAAAYHTTSALSIGELLRMYTLLTNKAVQHQTELVIAKAMS